MYVTVIDMFILTFLSFSKSSIVLSNKPWAMLFYKWQLLFNKFVEYAKAKCQISINSTSYSKNIFCKKIVIKNHVMNKRDRISEIII